jgi:hypothetical protein
MLGSLPTFPEDAELPTCFFDELPSPDLGFPLISLENIQLLKVSFIPTL